MVLPFRLAGRRRKQRRDEEATTRLYQEETLSQKDALIKGARDGLLRPPTGARLMGPKTPKLRALQGGRGTNCAAPTLFPFGLSHTISAPSQGSPRCSTDTALAPTVPYTMRPRVRYLCRPPRSVRLALLRSIGSEVDALVEHRPLEGHIPERQDFAEIFRPIYL